MENKDLKPIVGVMPLWDDEKESLWMLPGYLEGLVEALYRPESRFLWAVQWHPEFSFKTDENSKKLFRAFVEAMDNK